MTGEERDVRSVVGSGYNHGYAIGLRRQLVTLTNLTKPTASQTGWTPVDGHMKGKRKRDFRKQEAAKSKPRGALGGRHWQQDIAGDSFTLCAKFVAVNARPPHRSADRLGYVDGEIEGYKWISKKDILIYPKHILLYPKYVTLRNQELIRM